MSWNQYEAIHSEVKKSLVNYNFKEPTFIQHNVLENYRQYNHFLLASQTGSGKTLAFGIPIISEILSNPEYYERKRERREIACLILTPTRELAIQIHKHLQVISSYLVIGTLLGGMSKDKQKRILNKVPHIFIATPGRLWDFIENEQSDVLDNLNLIKYLVVDEADRMVELGHFPQLDQIIGKLTSPSQITHDEQEIKKALKRGHSNLYVGKQEINFEADKPVEMNYDDFIKLQQGKLNKKHQIEEEQQEQEEDQEEFEQYEEDEDEIVDEDEDDNSQSEEVLQQDDFEDVNSFQETNEDSQIQQEVQEDPNYNPQLRTFMVSATLTQKFQTGSKFKYLKNDQKIEKEDKKLQREVTNTLPKLQSLLGKLKIKSKPFIIDLTQQLIFPDQLEFYKSLVEEDDKLLYLYNYVEQRIDQQFIIFLNSISYANKVTSMLDVLQLKSVTLHSQQQQRQRLKRLDQFKNKKVSILVCTDVAARGLDISGVENVIHYQIPYTADTFVHRCGRTARINNSGTTLILIGPKDMVRYTRLEKDIEKSGIEIREFKLTYQQIQSSKQMIRQAQDLEKQNHILQKKKVQKEQIQKKLNLEDFDVDEKDLKYELQQLEQDIVTKRQQINIQSNNYKTIVSQKHKLDAKLSRRRNALFLTPDQIAKLQLELTNYKEHQKLKEQQKNKQKIAQQQQQLMQSKKYKKQQKYQQKM
ncbi:hypothetical protein pb186bvf_005125 [Paramecium bursaria]